jgi:hypothetical protein
VGCEPLAEHRAPLDSGAIPVAFAESAYNRIALGYDHKLLKAYREDTARNGGWYDETHKESFREYLKAKYSGVEALSQTSSEPEMQVVIQPFQAQEEPQRLLEVQPVEVAAEFTPIKEIPNVESIEPRIDLDVAVDQFDINGYIKANFDFEHATGDEIRLNCLSCDDSGKHLYWNTQELKGFCHKCSLNYRSIRIVHLNRGLEWVKAMDWMRDNPGDVPPIVARPMPEPKEQALPEIREIDMPPEFSPIEPGTAAEEYLQDRGFGRDVIDRFLCWLARKASLRIA